MSFQIQGWRETRAQTYREKLFGPMRKEDKILFVFNADEEGSCEDYENLFSDDGGKIHRRLRIATLELCRAMEKLESSD
jgi:hypothetical protein